jgi:uncharacterized membrane protein YbaN (DUF454 family)
MIYVDVDDDSKLTQFIVTSTLYRQKNSAVWCTEALYRSIFGLVIQTYRHRGTVPGGTFEAGSALMII